MNSHTQPRQPTLRWPVWSIAMSLVGVLLMAGSILRNHQAPASAPSNEPRQLFLAVDGLSWDAFTEAQSRGLFTRFHHAARMIAPYPSMSHPSWTEIIGTERAFGERGRLSTVEARWFDLDAMRVADDPRQVIARQASPFNYMRAFDTFFDPLIEPLMYFPGHRLFDRELEETERDILDGFHGHRYNAYISGTDAMAHTHLNDLHPFLVQLDSMIERTVAALEKRGGPVEVWMVSDHGNASAFREGQPESYLTPVSMNAAIHRAGLIRQDTGTVRDSSHVSVVTIALASMVNLYFPDLSRRRGFAREVLREAGVTLVTWLEVTDSTREIIVMSHDGGDASIRWHRAAPNTAQSTARDTTPGSSPGSWQGSSLLVAYHARTGNPLAIPDSLISRGSESRWTADSIMRHATANGPFPDAVHRLIASAEKRVENAPDLIVNLDDGYAHDGDFGRVVRMVRTHGSLSARASSGIVASTRTTLPPDLRAGEVADAMRMEPRTVLSTAANVNATDALARARALVTSPATIASGHADHSVDAEFLRRARPVVQSIGYLDWTQLRSVRELMPSSSSSSSSSSSNTRQPDWASVFKTLSKVDLLKGLSRGVDTLLALTDSIDTDALDTRLRTAADRVRGIPELAPLAELHDDWRNRSRNNEPDVKQGAGANARAAAMLAWTIPYFLDAALDVPEMDSMADPRDRVFAVNWYKRERQRVREHPERLLGTSAVGAQLFAQVFAERTLWQRAASPAISLLYNPDLRATTVVLIPGIYGELFDGELWQRGMRSVRERLGVRAFTARVDGRCSSAYNAASLLRQLRDDTHRRLERGYVRPRYLLIGYSKGGIDATEALLSDSAFAEQQIAALVTVATPHLGSPVAERAELPKALLAWASRDSMPTACKDDGAAPSLYPATRRAFWADYGDVIANRTKLFSVAFAADAHDAHPWMKLTKQVGQFAEPNDGVVAVSAAHFPSTVPSVNFGTIAADHIAGITASRFPQEAFLEALVVAVGETGALDVDRNSAWRVAQQQWMASPNRVIASDANATPFKQSLRASAPLPGGSAGWTASTTFRLLEADALHNSVAAQSVRVMTPSMIPQGFVMRCDQHTLGEFRREYEFMYDAGNGGHEGSLTNGFSIVADKASGSGRACRFATMQSAIKMTTVSVRFRPVDFPALSFNVRVIGNVTGVDPSTHKRGANDAAFKLWFVVRDKRPGASNATRLFGYTWTAVDRDNIRSPDGDLREAVSSKRSVVVKTLPEAWLVTVGDTRAGTNWQHIGRDLAADLRRAYPQVPIEAFEVVGVTIQSDSDESRGRSEVLLDEIAIRPRATVVRARP